MDNVKEEYSFFDDMNLNPDLFMNEVMNLADSLFEGAFDFFQQQTTTMLDSGGRVDIGKGVAHIRNLIQENLNKRLGVWEKYCLRHCFIVPDGLMPLINDEHQLQGSSLDDDNSNYSEMDRQLSSLRNKLSEVGRDCQCLHNKCNNLEKKLGIKNHIVGLLNDAILLNEEKHSSQELIPDLGRTTWALRSKIERLVKRRHTFSATDNSIRYPCRTKLEVLHNVVKDLGNGEDDNSK